MKTIENKIVITGTYQLGVIPKEAASLIQIRGWGLGDGAVKERPCYNYLHSSRTVHMPKAMPPEEQHQRLYTARDIDSIK